MDVDRRHRRRKITHGLFGDAIDILNSLRKADTLLQAAHHLVSPCAGLRFRKFLRRQVQGNPELCLIEVPVHQGIFEIARHHPNDGIGLSVKNDRMAEDMGIAVKAI